MAGTKKTLAEREELLLAVEEVMFQGIQNASFIARQLKLSTPTVQEYQKAILKRWELTNRGGAELFAKVRAEQIEKKRYIEFELWKRLGKSTNESAALGIIRTIIELQKDQCWLAGISKVLDEK